MGSAHGRIKKAEQEKCDLLDRAQIFWLKLWSFHISGTWGWEQPHHNILHAFLLALTSFSFMDWLDAVCSARSWPYPCRVLHRKHPPWAVLSESMIMYSCKRIEIIIDSDEYNFALWPIWSQIFFSFNGTKRRVVVERFLSAAFSLHFTARSH